MATIQQKELLQNNAELKLKVKYALLEAAKALANESTDVFGGNDFATAYFQARRARGNQLIASDSATLGDAVNKITRLLLEGSASQAEILFSVNINTVSIEIEETEQSLFDKIYGTVSAATQQQITFGKSDPSSYNYNAGVFDIYAGLQETQKPEYFTGTNGRRFYILNNDGVSVWDITNQAFGNPAEMQLEDYARGSFSEVQAQIANAGGGTIEEVRPTYPNWWYDANAAIYKAKL